jgi:hypothetical protein
LKKAILLLKNGEVFVGRNFGYEGETSGEVVFNTSMTGYQEILTDPSYTGQIVTMTYPLIGNYGVNDEDIESSKIQASGFVVREASSIYSNWRAKTSLQDYLKANKVVGIEGIETRKLKRKQFRSDIRVKTNIFTDIVPTNPQKTKKGYVFVDGKEKYSGLIVNISSGGAAVQSRAPIQVGSYYRIRFKILGEELEIPSKVVLERRAGPNTPDATFHLRFVGISVRARVFIQLYAYKLHPSLFAKSQKIQME